MNIILTSDYSATIFDIFEVVGVWISSLGTVAAVIVSLYLADKRKNFCSIESVFYHSSNNGVPQLGVRIYNNTAIDLNITHGSLKFKKFEDLLPTELIISNPKKIEVIPPYNIGSVTFILGGRDIEVDVKNKTILKNDIIPYKNTKELLEEIINYLKDNKIKKINKRIIVKFLNKLCIIIYTNCGSFKRGLTKKEKARIKISLLCCYEKNFKN